MTKTFRTLLAALSLGAMTMPLHAQTSTLDLSGITALKIQGKGSHTVVTADSGEKSGVSITQGRNRLCKVEPVLTRQGDVLTLEVRHSGFLPGLTCDAIMTLTLPAGIAVAVDQHEAVVDLRGRYSDVSLTTDKLVLTLNGGAQTLRVKADKAVITANFLGDIAGQPPVIDIAVPTLVANVGYPHGVPIEYKIDAPVAVFSHDIQQTLGAKGRLNITSQVLKGALYPVSSRS